jgi:serine/threonine protein kinase
VKQLSDAAVARLRDTLDRPALPVRYEPIEVIGRGGMGVVWRARDALLDRDVAVKVIASYLPGDEMAARLTREARIVARLEHPGVVPVYDVGALDDGRAWYVMRLVAGQPLDVAAKSIATRGELLRIVERLCDTVAYAHAHGVLHRDLKPGNVMLGPFGEVLVLDWGIARELSAGAEPPRSTPVALRLADGDVVTTSGRVLGTPGYMSPEQAAGSIVDERSDVFGLGAILRDLLSVHDTPIPRPLASIRDTATADDPRERYQSPLAMRDDIRRFLDGGRVLAHRETSLEAAARVVRVYRTPIALIGAYMLMRVAFLMWRRI